MARRKKVTAKQCAITGMNFPTTEFYVNNSSKDIFWKSQITQEKNWCKCSRS